MSSGGRYVVEGKKKSELLQMSTRLLSPEHDTLWLKDRSNAASLPYYLCSMLHLAALVEAMVSGLQYVKQHF